MPLRKVHELTFLWFGLPGPLLSQKDKPHQFHAHVQGCPQERNSQSWWLYSWRCWGHLWGLKATLWNSWTIVWTFVAVSKGNSFTALWIFMGDPFFGPAPLQKVVGDFCCISFGGFCRGFSWRIFLGTFSHKNEEKKCGDKSAKKSGGSKIKICEKSVLPKSDPNILCHYWCWRVGTQHRWKPVLVIIFLERTGEFPQTITTPGALAEILPFSTALLIYQAPISSQSEDNCKQSRTSTLSPYRAYVGCRS